MKVNRILIVCALVFTTLSLNGCLLALAGGAVAGSAAGGATIAYVSGSYSVNLDNSLDDVYNSAIEAIQDNDDYVLTKKVITPTEATIDGSSKADKTDFVVKVEKLTNKASKVTIKFGSFGNREASEALMFNIQKDLS